MKTQDKLIILTVAFSFCLFFILQNRKTNSLASLENLRSFSNTAYAFSENPDFNRHFCWICENPYGQRTFEVDCPAQSGNPGCYNAPCGYNYCEDV